MARMLTEEEVRKMEEQRELRERARAAGNATAGMGWRERERYGQQQLNERFKQASMDAMERRRLRTLANPSAEADTTYRHGVMRDAELRAARAHEMDRLGRELATREEEARQRRFGMAEQGMEAAKQNREATIRAAELQTAGAAQVAGINRDRDLGVAKLNAESAEKINEGKNKTAVEVANVNYDTSVDTAKVQAAKEYAQEMMRMRQVDEKMAMEYGKSVITEAQRMVNNSKNKRTGKPTMTMEEAIKKVEEERRRMGTVPGEPRKLGSFKR